MEIDANGSTQVETQAAMTETQPQGQSFGTLAYERVLTETECREVERVQKHLAASLDGVLHVWVHDARPFAHGRASTITPFTMKLHPSLPVAEVRDLIQEQYEEISSYREHTEGPLQLMFNGHTLEDGKLLAEYLSHDENTSNGKSKTHRGSWPTPYAGILWVVPFRANARFKAEMWGAAA